MESCREIHVKYKQKREENISEVMIIIITILIIVKNLTMVIIVIITIMIIDSDYTNTSWKLKGGNLPWSTIEIAENFLYFFHSNISIASQEKVPHTKHQYISNWTLCSWQMRHICICMYVSPVYDRHKIHIIHMWHVYICMIYMISYNLIYIHIFIYIYIYIYMYIYIYIYIYTYI